MTASRGPVATFSLVRSRPHASRMVRASLTTPAGVMSVHPQPLPEAPDGDGGAEGDEAGRQACDGVGDGAEGELGCPAGRPGAGGGGCCVAHGVGSFQLVRTMTIEPTGAVA
nr:MAG TPA: hypothetical protein [Caudoviricetes sp.]